MRDDLKKFMDDTLVAERQADALKVILPKLEPFLKARNDLAAQVQAVTGKIENCRSAQAQAQAELEALREERLNSDDPSQAAKLSKRQQDLRERLADLEELDEDLERQQEKLEAEADKAHKELFLQFHRVQAEYCQAVQGELDAKLMEVSQFQAAYREGMDKALKEIALTAEYPQFGMLPAPGLWGHISPLRVRPSQSIYKLNGQYEPVFGVSGNPYD